jgi:hypothetical protein
MQTLKTTILVACLAGLAGCASYVKQADVCIDRWYGYVPQGPCPSLVTEAPRDFAAELAAAQNEIQSLGLRLSTVKALLADREKELAGLRAERDRK